MNTLTEAINALVDARRVSKEANLHWLSLMRAGSPDQGEARKTFLAADNQVSLRAGELGKIMTDLRAIFCLEIAIESLPEEMRLTLRKSIAELRFDHLLAPHRPTALAELGNSWRKSCAMFDAARSMAEKLRGLEEAPTLTAIRQAAGSYRKPEAWEQVVSVCEILQASTRELHLSPADIVHAAVKHLRKVYDQYTEQVRVVLEELHYAGALGTELSELEPDLRRYLQDALASGLVRERQLQPQAKRKEQTVTTMETETEEEVSDDYGN